MQTTYDEVTAIMSDDTQVKVESRSWFHTSGPFFLFLAAQTIGGIWWAATLTADVRNLNDTLKTRDVQQAAEINQLRGELQTLKQDQRTLEIYNQNLREKLAARGILISGGGR
jgi:hypothetical protein